MMNAPKKAKTGFFGIPVNGFHPQLTAVANPVGPNAVPPPSWPLYVPPQRNTGTTSIGINNRARTSGDAKSVSHKRTGNGGYPAAPTTTDALDPAGLPASTPPSATSTIDARTAKVVRRLQDDAREIDRSRSELLRKRLRREEKSTRRRLKRMRSSNLSSSTEGSSSTTCSSSEGTSISAGSSISGLTTASGSEVSDAGGDTTTFSTPSTTITTATSIQQQSCDGDNDETHFSELYADVFMASDRPQFMATLGGRLVAWNKEFLEVTGAAQSQLRGCMTVHNLINPTYHIGLNNMFELALRGDTVSGYDSRIMSSSGGKSSIQAPPLSVVANKEETSSSAAASAASSGMAPPHPSSVSLERPISPRSELSGGTCNDAATTSSSFGRRTDDKDADRYTSVTLPCVCFPRASVPLQMTIVLMNDMDPSRRCFYCVMSPLKQQQPPPATIVGVLDPLVANAGTCKQVGNSDDDNSTSYSAFLSAAQGGSGQSIPEIAARSRFVLAPQTSILGMIRRIDQEELASFL